MKHLIIKITRIHIYTFFSHFEDGTDTNRTSSIFRGMKNEKWSGYLVTRGQILIIKMNQINFK